MLFKVYMEINFKLFLSYFMSRKKFCCKINTILEKKISFIDVSSRNNNVILFNQKAFSNFIFQIRKIPFCYIMSDNKLLKKYTLFPPKYSTHASINIYKWKSSKKYQYIKPHTIIMRKIRGRKYCITILKFLPLCLQ